MWEDVSGKHVIMASVLRGREGDGKLLLPTCPHSLPYNVATQYSSSVWSRYSNLNICIWHVWHTESVPCQQSHQESYPNHITLCYCKSVGNAKTFCRSNAIVICAFRGMKLQPHIPTTAPVSLVRWISNQRPPLYVEYCLFHTYSSLLWEQNEQ